LASRSVSLNLREAMPFDEFLKDAALLLGLHGRAFQRRGIKRRLERRMADIGVSGFDPYLSRVNEDPQERNHLAEILAVTISRFFRDKDVFARMEASVIPSILGKGREELRAWSIGCASGEEPYSLAILWKEKFQDKWPAVRFILLATDIDEGLLKRARQGRYKGSSLREVPEDLRGSAFRPENGFFVLSQDIRQSVRFERHDMLQEDLFLGMDVIFCRNLAFTYFSRERQMDVLKKIFMSLEKGGYLCIGKTENLPLMYPTLFIPVHQKERIYRKFE
jgi:chemotaxis protein methyltransferase CheR